jgi:hypothetical protein
MASRYDRDPNVAYILIGGLGEAFEPFMAKFPKDIQSFEALGGLPLWKEGCKKIIDLYAQNFLSTPFVMTMHAPIPTAEGRAATESVVRYGLEKYPGRFGVKFDGLDAGANAADSYHKFILEWSSKTTVGYQMVWSSKGINAGWLKGSLEECLKRAVDLKAHFVEVYSSDCTNQDNFQFLKTASLNLKSNIADKEKNK